MPERYFGGAPNAFAGGMEFGAAQRMRRIRENALATLIERFGPVAGDPQSLAMLQRAEQSAELHPYDVAEAKRVDAARNAAVAGQGVIAGDPAVQQRDIEQRMQTMKRGAAVLEMTKERGGDLGKAFDLVQSLLPSLGIPSDRFAAAREAIVTDPDSVDELVALLRDPEKAITRRAMSGGQAFYDKQTGELVWGIPTESGELRVVPGYTPAIAAQAETRLEHDKQRIGLGYTTLDWNKYKEHLPARSEGVAPYQGEDGQTYVRIIPGSKAAFEHNKDLRKDDVEDRSLVRTKGIADERIQKLRNAVTTSVGYFDKAPAGIVPQNFRRAARWAAGTPAHEGWRALETVKSLVGAGQLQVFREASKTGASGFGALSERELDLLERLYGDLSITGDPKVIAQTLREIGESFERLYDYTTQDAEQAQRRMEERKSQYIEAPETSASGGTQGRYSPDNPFATGNR